MPRIGRRAFIFTLIFAGVVAVPLFAAPADGLGQNPNLVEWGAWLTSVFDDAFQQLEEAATALFSMTEEDDRSAGAGLDDRPAPQPPASTGNDGKDPFTAEFGGNADPIG